MQLPYDLEIVLLGIYHRELNTENLFTSVYRNVIIQFSSVAQSCPTLCAPMNRSTPGLPVHHQLLEFTQTHVYRVGDAIQHTLLLLAPKW